MNFFSLFNKKETPTTQTPQAPQKPKVLVVEDETDIRDVYVELLLAENFDVLTAGNGQEAMNQILNQKPAVIILDIIMPLMDGMQVLEQLKNNEQTKDIPVVVLTNAGNIDNMESAKYHHAYRFLIKSNIVPSEVVKAAKDALAVSPLRPVV